MKVRQSLILSSLLFLASVLLSPKWLVPLAAWVVPILLIRLFRTHTLWKAILLVYIPTSLGGIIANYGVVPYPLPIFLGILLLGGLFGLIPLLLDRWLHSRLPDLLATLVYPAAVVLLDYWTASGPQGVWGNVANTQYGFLPLMQLASVTGIWGIGFLIYWAGPMVNLLDERWRQKASLRPAMLYGGLLLLVIAGGGIRMLTAPQADKNIKVAGLSVNNLFILQRMYEAEKGEPIMIPSRISQSDPALAELSSVYPAFFAESSAPRFTPVLQAYEESLENLFQQSLRAVDEGAEVIVWSEGSVTCLKFMEQDFIAMGQQFAAEHQVYLFFPMAVFLPDQFDTGQPYLENKVLSIDPQGTILHTYYKNVPVPDLEPSVPGDGKLAVFATPHGKISPAICYDADFPAMMRQLSELDSELLVLPSGDWDAIDPIHGRMALIRGIENGCAVLRPVNQARTLASDAYGRVLALDDFFADEDHLLIVDLPIQSVSTLYGRFGDWFVWVCGMILIVCCGLWIWTIVAQRIKLRRTD
ncbi:MAG: nitrilase-related carbon-nitrogen hydrolase [Bacteroidota bacterium]